MYSKITVAVAGTGFIGPVHVEALRRLGISVRGILGSTPEKSAKAARHLGLVKAYTSYTELLQDPEVQAIHIATPNIAHFPMVKDALLAGKHVMCEKPLAMTSTETTELVNLAKTSGLVTGVTYNIRFYPMNLEARQLIHEESVGKIFSISGSYVQDWLLYENDYNWRVSSDKGGALRAVADIGTHWIDLIYSITGLDVEAVCANLTTVHSVRHKPVGEVETFTGSKKDLSRQPISVDTEDCGSILFRYKNGAQGILWVSQVTAGYKNRIRYEIAGSKQSISWDSDKAN